MIETNYDNLPKISITVIDVGIWMILPWLETKQPGENPCIPLCDHIPFYVPMPGIEHLLLLLEARVLTTDNPLNLHFPPMYDNCYKWSKIRCRLSENHESHKIWLTEVYKDKIHWESVWVSYGLSRPSVYSSFESRQIFRPRRRPNVISLSFGKCRYISEWWNLYHILLGLLAFEPAILFSLNLQNILDQWVIYTIIRELHCRK